MSCSVFSVLNVAVLELSTFFAIRAEETTPTPQEERYEEDERIDMRKLRLEKAIKIRTAMRNKAIAQTVLTGTLIISVVLALLCLSSWPVVLRSC